MTEIKLPDFEWDDFETRFPHLFLATEGRERRLNQLVSALEIIKTGHETGSIRNVEYKQAKEDISRLSHTAWDAIFAQYIAKFREKANPPEVEEFMNGVSIYGLNEFRFLKKKIDSANFAGVESQVIDNIISIEAEIAPLAHLVTAMKNIVVKGRAPREIPAKLDNPDQVRGTCPCCFSNQAVVHHTMALHGYQRPGEGFQTASCSGASFQPYEKSPEGTMASLEGVLRQIAKLERTLENPPNTLQYSTGKMTRIYSGKYEAEVITINAEHPEWNNTMKNFIHGLEMRKRRAIESRDFLQNKIDTWAPQELKTVMGKPAPAGIGGQVYAGKPQTSTPSQKPTTPSFSM